jgi:Flp pilus assembly protein TadG
VIFAAGIAGFLAMVALVVDGANYYAQNRAAQKAADAISQAGATVIARALLEGTTATGAEIKQAMDDTAIANGLPALFSSDDAPEAFYTDIDGTPLLAGAVPIEVGQNLPACGSKCINNRAVGVRTVANRTFSTLIAGVVGQGEFTVSPTAVAVAGYVDLPCDADGACPLIPVAVAEKEAACAGGDATYPGNRELLPDALATPLPSMGNEVELVVCADGNGALGWLDFNCGPAAPVPSQVTTPCNGPTDLPAWIKTWSGNPGDLQTALNSYAGANPDAYEQGKDRVILVPIFDAVCNDPSPTSGTPVQAGSPDPFPKQCSGYPSGSAPHYRIVAFTGFIVNQAYLQSGASASCPEAIATSPASSAASAESGRTTTHHPTTTPPPPTNAGCVKGWLTSVAAPPGTVTVERGPDPWPRPISIQLIK